MNTLPCPKLRLRLVKRKRIQCIISFKSNQREVNIKIYSRDQYEISVNRFDSYILRELYGMVWLTYSLCIELKQVPK